MSNPGQPTIQQNAHGEPVRRLQRALRRALPDPGLVVDGAFGPQTRQLVEDFQQGRGLTIDGIVGPATWAALPDGGPMPVLQQGAQGHVVQRLQEVLALGAWGGSPGPPDGIFGTHTADAVRAFQASAGLASDGIVGERTWDAPVGAMMATLETEVGLTFVIS